MRRSIGIKLTIAFLVLAVIPMSATTYYNLTRGQNEVARVAREELMELSRSAAQSMGQLLTENQRTSATLAGEPLTVQFLAASEEEREALSPQVYQMLQNFADTHPDYDAPGLLDANGIVVASLSEALVGKDRSFRDYFQASIQGQPYVSSMLVGRATGQAGVFLTNPVVMAEGEIVGIDIVWLKGDTVWSIIDDAVAGEEGIAYLVDQDGVIIAHPDRDLLYHSLGQLTPEAAATISATIRFGTVEDTDTPLMPESLGMDDLAAELASQGCGDYHYHSPLDDRDHVVGYTRLEAYPWTVVVDVPEAQFLAPLRRLGIVAWGSVGVVAAITLIVSILLVWTITRPLHRLTEAASAVERGQPFEPSDIEDVTSGRDEIAHLGRVLSNMVLALHRREERIDHLNLVLRAIRNVNQLISGERDRDRLLKSACDTLIETRGYHNTWIALLDESGELITTAEAGLGEVFLPLVEQLKRGELTDCAWRALKQSDVVITQDPLSSCANCPLSAGYGDREAMTVQLEHGEKVYGLMSVSIPAGFTTDEEEQSLFHEVAGDIAFALYGIELEEEHKRAEEALKESEEKHRLLAENTSDAIWKMDLNLEFTYVNPAILDVLGFTPQEWIGSRLPEHCSPQEMQKMANIITHELENLGTHTGVVFETYLYDKHSEKIACEITGKLIFDETGRPIGLQGTTRDITERKRAEVALQEYTQRLETLQVVTGALSTSLALDEVLELILEQLAAVVDYDSAAIFLIEGERLRCVAGRGHPHPEQALGQLFPVDNELFQEALTTRQPITLADAQADPRFQRWGDADYVRGWLSVPLQARGEMIGHLTIDSRQTDAYGPAQVALVQPFANQSAQAIENARLHEQAQQEITERKQAEEALKEYSERLEEMVEERTKELREAQEQLVRREKLAVLGQLAGGVGHELRNPLGVISNAVYFLKMALSDADETTREYLDMISSEVRDSEKIIFDLLDFSRTKLPEREKIAVSDLVAQVLAKRPPPEEVAVTTQIPSDLPPVFVDPRQIGQVLGNLVTNGYQAMPDGGGLTITAEFVEGGAVRNPKSQIRIGVSDTGCGIPAENMEKIFEPLFTTKPEGIGLGLALVKTLVEANGGSIEVESEVGKGSTFAVRLQSV